ncbi:MAG TPA: hypothetical protein PKC28_12030 [Bdellovibrionales bacterium]|nr:hypothetical protein [Bdellovibrionales bacterium]
MIGRWSLERVQFALQHLEDFIDENTDDETQRLRERAKNFAVQGGLEKVETFAACDPQDPQLPLRLTEGLAPFFDCGLLLQRGLSGEGGNWWVTDLFWRGNTFHLDLKDQIRANSFVPEITPMQVHRATAGKLLERLNLNFMSPASEAPAFLLKPTPVSAYVLISNVGEPWLEDHVSHAQRLINKCFLY